MMDILNTIKSIIFLSFATSYILGFIIWNSFLGQFGFFEYNLLQTRYVSAGAIFIIIHGIVLFLAWLGVKNLHRNILKILALFTPAIFIIYLFNIYPRMIFPNISQSFGGARPDTVSIIGTPEQIKYLSNFNIQSAENSGDEKAVQTYPVCNLYQNQDYILIGVGTPTGEMSTNEVKVFSRVIILRQDQILGFQSFKEKEQESSPWFGLPCRVSLNS